MKRKPIKRKFITNQPNRQNVGKVNSRKAGKIMKPYGGKAVPTP